MEVLRKNINDGKTWNMFLLFRMRVLAFQKAIAAGEIRQKELAIGVALIKLMQTVKGKTKCEEK